MVQHSYLFSPRRCMKIYQYFEQSELMCICLLPKRTNTSTEGSPIPLDVIILISRHFPSLIINPEIAQHCWMIILNFNFIIGSNATYINSLLPSLLSFPGIRVQWHCDWASRVRWGSPTAGRSARKHLPVANQVGPGETWPVEGARFLSCWHDTGDDTR